MHRILEAFDKFFSTAIVFVYLCAMMLGTGTYFLGHAFAIPALVTIAIAFSLATAAEVHSFLEQRHTRDYYQRLQHVAKENKNSPEADQLRGQFWLHLAFTAGLVLFSMLNGIAFWALEARPATFGDWLAITLRGVIVPLFFLAAGFLTPLHADPHEDIDRTAHAMLTTTLTATQRQFRQRVKQVRESGADLTPLTVALLEDAGDTIGAERLRLISYGLAIAEGSDPPTFGPFGGPGAPTIKFVPEPSDAENRIRAYLTGDPHANPTQIAQATEVSLSTASKYWHILGDGRRSPRGRTTRSQSQPRQQPTTRTA